jgi:hypothetical protein
MFGFPISDFRRFFAVLYSTYLFDVGMLEVIKWKVESGKSRSG